MDFATLVDRVKFVVDNNDGGTSQAFTTARVKQAINMAYNNEYTTAMLEGQRSWFITTRTLTWLANVPLFTLPKDMSQDTIIRIRDMTDSNLGRELVFSATGFYGDLFWHDKNNLQWGASGPTKDKTLEFAFIPNIVDMVDDDDEPELLPNMFHNILIWSAAIMLLEIADQVAPQPWYKNQEDTRLNMLKYLSLGRPQVDTPKIVNTDASDVGSTFGLY
jgi:hypothetical protein